MVLAWYIDSSNTDRQLPHHLDPPQYADFQTISQKTGVLFFKLNADGYEEEGQLSKIRKERGYTYFDIIEIHEEKLPEFYKKTEMFYREHIHADEEIRFVLAGNGYFDIRDANDRWLRLEISKGDLLILPAGIYHRFTLTSSNYIQLMRLFAGEPVWTAHNRPADDHPARIQYLQRYSK